MYESQKKFPYLDQYLQDFNKVMAAGEIKQSLLNGLSLRAGKLGQQG